MLISTMYTEFGLGLLSLKRANASARLARAKRPPRLARWQELKLDCRRFMLDNISHEGGHDAFSILMVVVAMDTEQSRTAFLYSNNFCKTTGYLEIAMYPDLPTYLAEKKGDTFAPETRSSLEETLRSRQGPLFLWMCVLVKVITEWIARSQELNGVAEDNPLQEFMLGLVPSFPNHSFGRHRFSTNNLRGQKTNEHDCKASE